MQVAAVGKVSMLVLGGYPPVIRSPAIRKPNDIPTSIADVHEKTIELNCKLCFC